MGTAKQELQQVLDELPEDVSMDAALYEIQFKASVLRGLDEAARGEGISHEEVGRKIARWVESSGRQKLSET